jgi:hypothetical protein
MKLESCCFVRCSRVYGRRQRYDSAYCGDGQHCNCCYDNDGTSIGCCKNDKDVRVQRMITTKPVIRKAEVGDSPYMYCEVGHFGENPCKQDGTDFCCDYSCTYCGPQEYCDQYSPFLSDSGVYNFDYTPPPGTDICANYFEPCTGTPPPPTHQACQLCAAVGNSTLAGLSPM